MSSQSVITLFAVAVGLSFALIAWVLSRLAAQVPKQDRIWLDPPPLGYRLLWWPVQWVAYYFGGLLPTSWHTAVLTRLRVAGVDFALSPSQYLAGRVVWGVVLGAIAVWLAAGFGMGGGWAFAGGFLLGYFYPAVWLRDRIDARRRETLKTLPFMLDIITLCVESGLNMTGAIQQAVDKGPSGALKSEFSRLLRDVRAGKSRTDALRELSQRMNLPPISNFVTTLIQAEATGMSLGPILRTQAEQRRIERFARAEKLAMEAPVKLLFPLIAFIFPCVFAILLFPIVMKFMAAGS